MSLRLIRTLCFGAFLAGLPAIIVSSIRGNNEGWVVSIGLTTTAAAIVLIVVSTVTAKERIHVFNEVEAEYLDTKIDEQVKKGASEEELRDIVRRAIALGQRSA